MHGETVKFSQTCSCNYHSCTVLGAKPLETPEKHLNAHLV